MLVAYIVKVENESVVSRLYFVDLAGSGSSLRGQLIERYERKPNDAEEYSEAMCISADLENLRKALLSLSQEEAIPKSTTLIETLADLLKKESNITLIGHIIATNYEESISTVQYIERCKADMKSNSKVAEAELWEDDSDQEVAELRKVNRSHQNEIDQVERYYKAKFEKIKNMLGLNIDVKEVLEKGLTGRDRASLESNKLAEERVKNVAERNSSLLKRIGKSQVAVSSLREKIEDKSAYFNHLIEDLKQEFDRLTAKCNALKDEYAKLPETMATQIEEERSRVAEIKKIDLEKRLRPLFAFQGTLNRHNQSMVEARRVYDNESRNFRDTYKTRMKNFNKQHSVSIVNLETQFQHYLKERKEMRSAFIQEAELYCTKKKQLKRDLEKELMGLSKVMHRQAEIIRKAEVGVYTNGIKNIYISQIEKSRSISSMSRPTTCQGMIRHNSRISDIQSRRRSKV